MNEMQDRTTQRKLVRLGALAFLGAAVAVAVPAAAAAQGVSIRTGENTDSIARFVDRRAPAAADFAITSVDGNRVLMLLPDAIALQLTDAGLERIANRPAATDERKSAVALLVEGMVRGGLRVLLDRSLEYDLRELREVRVENGRLVFENRTGDPVFDRMNIDGQDFMEGFAPRDARAFADRVNRRLRQRGP
jgi:hypothetical protein